MSHTPALTEDALSGADRREKAARAAAKQEHGFGELRHYVPADLLDVSFSAAVRGYDRRAVDTYVERVSRVIAELKVSASPPAAVRHALEQAGQQVHGLLQSARQTAEEIITSARQEAEEVTARASAGAAELVVNTSAETDRLQEEANAFVAGARTDAANTVAKAKAEAAEILSEARAEAESIVSGAHSAAAERLRRLEAELAALQAEAEGRMREIQSDTEAVWDERSDFLDDIRGMAAGLADFADAAAVRFPHRQAFELEVAVEEPTVADELLAAVEQAASTPDA